MKLKLISPPEEWNYAGLQELGLTWNIPEEALLSTEELTLCIYESRDNAPKKRVPSNKSKINLLVNSWTYKLLHNLYWANRNKPTDKTSAPKNTRKVKLWGYSSCGYSFPAATVFLRLLFSCGHCFPAATVFLRLLFSCGSCFPAGTVFLRVLFSCGYCFPAGTVFWEF